MARCARHIADDMLRAGLTHAEVVPTAGHPVVYGEWLRAPGKPTVLVYGHYDVQPVEPLDLWTTPPFSPSVRDGRLYARGAIVDRTKDLVKSGGEWISSVELEGALMGHPAILEAAVVGVASEKWDERPVACVVKKPDQDVTKEELIEFLAPSFPKWWLPDDVVFVDEIPKTSVGKFDKKVLRERFKGHAIEPPSE